MESEDAGPGYVNQDPDLKLDGKWECPECRSQGFEPSISGKGCTFCDGTEGGSNA